MNEAYQNLSELMDKWLSDSSKEMKMARIEKDILLEKLRNLYVLISNMETEEYAAPQEIPASEQPQKQYTPAKTLEEDVDLFMDPEHESYHPVEQELQKIADEIEEAQTQPTPKSEPAPVTIDQQEKNNDIFDQLEEENTDKEEDTEIHDNAEDLFIEPDFEIKVSDEVTESAAELEIQEEIENQKDTIIITKKEIVNEEVAEEMAASEEEDHAEDDILQFIPPKSAPTQPQSKPVQQPAPKPEPAQKPTPEPEVLQQTVVQKIQQRSLNDLFNEQREDHSISSQYQRAKVGDLTKAISINDKFIYIKELFHNRGEDFSTSIKQLNECQNMEEAFNCLDQLKQKFFWDSKSDAYLSFCDLLRRKYS